MSSEEPKPSPKDPENPDEIGQNVDVIFSPRFKSVAAMAGWDEEAILIASLVVEDTPDRESKYKKRSDPQFKTPPTSSRRKRKAQRRSPISIPAPVLDLDEEETARKENEKNKSEIKGSVNDEKKIGAKESPEQNTRVSCSSSVLPCMDKLKEELSCAICLEICFEPSTTSCGHSFCKKCLRSAADKCGKRCPKCRQLISNGRSCTVNTVLWNTIQLLFPQEVEARKAAGALNSRETVCQIPETAFYDNLNRSTRAPGISIRDANARRRRGIILSDDEDDAAVSSALRSQRGVDGQNQTPERGVHRRNVRNLSTRPSRVSSRDTRVTRRRGMLSQDEDAALALRLQREEFLEVFSGADAQPSGADAQPSRPLYMARANLRAMASRAVNLRIIGRHL